MSGRILLIDGYNVLYAAGFGQVDYLPGDLLRCRNRLLRLLLDRLSHSEIREATLVFDARDPPPDRPAELRIGGLRIQFANPGGDADALIRNWLARHPAPQRVTLISGDRELQRSARSAGAKFVDSHAFLEKLQQRQPDARRRTGLEDDDKPGLLPGTAQTAEWLRYFGDLSGILAAADEPSETPVQRETPVPPAAGGATSAPGGSMPGEAGHVRSPAGPTRRRSGRQPDRDEKHLPQTGDQDLAELERLARQLQQELEPEGADLPDLQRRRELEKWLADELKRPPGGGNR